MLVPFLPPPGLSSDHTTFEDEGRWADGSNVRFWEGRPETIGGWSLLHSGLGANITDIFGYDNGVNRFAAYAGGTKLYVGTRLGTPTDCTPSPAPAAPFRWFLGAFGSTLLANPSATGGLYELPTPGVPATLVATAPAVMTCMLVTPERQVLAFGCNEEVSGALNYACIRGSDLEDYTDWTTSPTNNAFEHILEGSGAILSAALVGPYVGVWTSAGLWQGQFLGDPAETYRFDRVADGVGAQAQNTVTVHNGVAYWLGRDQNFYAWSPGAPPQIIPCPIGKDFRNNVTWRSFTVVATNAPYDEIWILYPDGRDGSGTGPTRYLAYCVGESERAQAPVWYRGQLARGSLSVPGPLAFDLFGQTLMGDNSGNVYTHEIAGIGPDSWFIQSADQYFDQSRRRLMVKGVVPDFEYQSGDISLTLSMRDRPQSAATTKGPYTLASTTTKKDFRASGKIAAFRFAGAGTRARLGKPCFDVVPTGER